MRLSSETSTYESLPQPYVLYPRGAFPIFSETENSNEYYMCACMKKKAVLNYLHLRAVTHLDEKKLDIWNFPQHYVTDLELQVDFLAEDFEITDWYKHIDFKENLCHRCHKKRPEHTYCPESEGTVFRQAYGWYLDMKHYEYGVVPRLQRYIKEMESKQLHEIIDFSYVSLLEDMMYDASIEGLPETVVQEWLEEHDKIWTSGSPRIWDPQYPYNFVTTLKKRTR